MATSSSRPSAARPPSLLTVGELAEIVRYHPKSIYRLVKRDAIPGTVRIGGGIRFDRSRVWNWADRRSQR